MVPWSMSFTQTLQDKGQEVWHAAIGRVRYNLALVKTSAGNKTNIRKLQLHGVALQVTNSLITVKTFKIDKKKKTSKFPV